MSDEERQHLEDLLQTYQRRLRVIEKQIATFGPRTPPEIQLEYEDIRIKITEIKAQLSPDSSLSSIPPRTSSDTTRANRPVKRNTNASPSVPYQGASEAPRLVPRDNFAIRNTSTGRSFSSPRWIPIGIFMVLLVVAVWVILSLRNSLNPRSIITATSAAIPTQPIQAIIPAQSTSLSIIPSATLPQGKRIAFVSFQNTNYDIYTMNIDGSDRRNVTNSVENDDAPAWSLDGRRIAFISQREGDKSKKVYVMNADGTSIRRVTDYPGIDGVPSWSPDGQYIAYQSLENNDFEIYIVNVNRGERRKLLDDPSRADLFPAWSPDGKTIAFVAPNEAGQLQIYIINADGTGGLKNLTNNGVCNSGPSWSPDGKLIAFVSHFDSGTSACPAPDPRIYLMPVDQSTPPTRLTESDEQEGIPSWAPDGRTVAFQIGSDGNRRIQIINLDSRHTETIVGGNSYWPAWSPPLR